MSAERAEGERFGCHLPHQSRSKKPHGSRHEGQAQSHRGRHHGALEGSEARQPARLGAGVRARTLHLSGRGDLSRRGLGRNTCGPVVD